MDRRSGSLLAIPVVVSVVVVGGVLLWAPLFMASDQASILRTPNEDDETEKNRRETHTDKPEDSVCGLWLAPSTIPGAGLGMYAGMDFVPGQEFIRGGDSVVAISDIKQHNANVFYNHTRRDFLWDEYTWSGAFLRMDREGYHHVDAASAGFGASVNCHMPLNNVDESYPVLVNNGLHRAHHAGAGASTVFHRRLSTASQYVSAGSELFVSCTYVSQWRFSSSC